MPETDLVQNQLAGVGVSEGASGGTTLAAGVGLLNILAGLLLVGAFLFFFGGLITWCFRLGMVGRDYAVAYMRYGVTMLFMLVVGLALIRFVQFHTTIVLGAVAVASVVIVGWIAVTFKGEPEEETKKR